MNKYLVIDCETLPRPIPPGIYKDKMEKLKDRFTTPSVIEKNAKEWAEESAFFQPGLSQVIAIGACDPDSGNVEVFCDENEQKVLNLFATYYIDFVRRNANVFSNVSLVGFNIKGFDLPQMMVNLGSLKPEYKLNRRRIIDLMDEPFGRSTNKYSLNYYLEIFGLPLKEGSGKDVLKNWELDKADKGTRVADYCRSDTYKTAALFNRYREFWNFDV